MSYFVKEADGNFHYSYYGVVDRVMAEYVNPQGIEAYIQNEQFSNAVKGSYKNIDLTGKRKRDLERFEAKKKRTAQESKMILTLFST